MKDRDAQFATEGIKNRANAGRRRGRADVREVAHGCTTKRGEQRRDSSGIAVKERTDFPTQPGFENEQIRRERQAPGNICNGDASFDQPVAHGLGDLRLERGDGGGSRAEMLRQKLRHHHRDLVAKQRLD